MRGRLILTLFFLALGAGALWDAHDTLAVPSHVIVKGLAQDDWSHNEDRAALGVTQWYAWGMGSCAGDYAHCTPMNRNWDLAAQTFCPPSELLGNEPTDPEPAGHPIAASVAASVTVAIKQQCPSTQIVAANIYLNGSSCWSNTYGALYPCALDWIKDYQDAYYALTGQFYGAAPNVDGRTDRLGVHLYCYDEHSNVNEFPWPCLNALQALETYVAHLPVLWITETGIPGPPGSETNWGAWLNDLTLDSHIERVYAWTNRNVDCGCDDPMNLIDSSGQLTPRGQLFHDWPAQGWQMWLPSVGAGQGYP